MMNKEIRTTKVGKKSLIGKVSHINNILHI